MSVFVASLRKAQNDHRAKEIQEAQKRAKFTSANVGKSAVSTHGYALCDKSLKETGIVDKVTKFRLWHRYMDEELVDAQLEGIRVFSVGQLLATMCPPHFERPSDPNIVVTGIVARKGEIRYTEGGSKYLWFSLCDLDYDICLSLHGKAFQKFWKIRAGTVIAVLNPRFYVEKRGTSTLGLSLSEGAKDQILEIGHARDLGHCIGMANGGSSRCKNWVDLRTTEVCGFHQEQRTRKTMAKRPEFNSTVTLLNDPVEKGKKLSVFKGGNVQWRQGLVADSQAPQMEYAHVFSSGPRRSNGTFDDPLEDSARAKKREKRHREEVENEARIRKKLAQRPGGYLLREFDQKGQLVETDETPESIGGIESSDRAKVIFTPDLVRSIGFNPAKISTKRQIVKSSVPMAQQPGDTDDEGLLII